jgi:NADPH-dependent 7-cyano-7-deazaguanine reductase QueF
MKVKHSKYKNTGILFELLSRQLTSDTVEGVKPHSLDIIGKFFRKGTQLHEELQYYNVLNVTKYKDVKKASILLETV